MRERQRNSTGRPITFLMTLASDHISGATGITPAVTISKDGGAFAPPAGAVTEVGNGWYALAGNASDRDTLGALLIHATAAGCDPMDVQYTITGYDPFDGVRMGMSAFPNVAQGSPGALPTGDGSGRVTVASNADKSGYSLSQGFPTNFASLAIDSNGRILVQYGTAAGQINLAGGNLQQATFGTSAPSWYTAPNNASITGIKAVTDALATMLVVVGAGPDYQFTVEALELAPAGGGGGGGATAVQVRQEMDANSTQLAALRAVSNHLATMLEPDGSDYRLTAASLINAPTGGGGGGGGASVDEIVAGLMTDTDPANRTAAGSLGKLIDDSFEIFPRGTVVAVANNRRFTVSMGGDVIPTGQPFANQVLRFLTGTLSDPIRQAQPINGATVAPDGLTAEVVFKTGFTSAPAIGDSFQLD